MRRNSIEIVVHMLYPLQPIYNQSTAHAHNATNADANAILLSQS